MSPLHIEASYPVCRQWVEVGKINPTDPPKSISGSTPNSMDIYAECAGNNSVSTIYRPGLDPSKPEIVKVLEHGESFEMDVRPDGSKQSTRLRFTHK